MHGVLDTTSLSSCVSGLCTCMSVMTVACLVIKHGNQACHSHETHAGAEPFIRLDNDAVSMSRSQISHS